LFAAGILPRDLAARLHRLREFGALAGRRMECDDEPNRHGLSSVPNLYRPVSRPARRRHPEGYRALPTDTPAASVKRLSGSPILEAELTVIGAALRSFIARLPSNRAA